MQTSEKPLFAVVGAGRWGRNWIRELRHRHLLSMICEPNVKLWKDDDTVRWTEDLEDVLRSEDVKIVVIVTPNRTHHGLAMRALKAGKHVFVEKPLATCLEHARELSREAESRQLKLFVGHILHYHVNIIRLLVWFQTHPTEAVEYITVRRGRYTNDDRGHLLWDLAPHDVSVVLRLAAGKKIRKLQVSCVGPRTAPKEIFAKLQFEGGPSVHLCWTRLSLEKCSGYTIFTTNYILRFDDTQSQLSDKLKIIDRVKQVRWNLQDLMPWSSPLEMELDALISYVTKSIVPHTTGEEGCSVVAVIERLQEALLLEGEGEGRGKGKDTGEIN